MSIANKIILATLIVFVLPNIVLATTNINSTDRYAWSENAGYIDFGTTQGNVQVTSTELTGYAYSSKIGWISLNCSNDNSCQTVNYKVANDGYGGLYGYAWSENAGWINFDPANAPQGVTINATGFFFGYAYSPKIGWIVFNCENTNSCGNVSYKVVTTYKPPERPSGANAPDPGPMWNKTTIPTPETPTTTPITPTTTPEINSATQTPQTPQATQALITQIKTQLIELIRELITMLQAELQGM